MSFFVIITPGRSGSTRLCYLLSNHPEIECDEEVFNRSRKDANSFNGFCKRTLFTRILAFIFNRDRILKACWNVVVPFLWRRFFREKSSNARNYGFKITMDQLEAYPKLFSFLNQKAKIIFLTRRDKLRMTLSLIKSRKRDNYDVFDAKPMTFETEAVKQIFNEILAWEKFVQKKMRDFITVEAEDLFDHPTTVLKEIQQFLTVEKYLKLSPKSLESRLNPENIRDWVKNYDEIHESIKEIDL